MRLLEGAGYGQIGSMGVQRGTQPGDQVGGQEGRVAGGRGHQGMGGRRQCGMQPGQRAGEAGNAVGHHAMAESGIALVVLIGVDE